MKGPFNIEITRGPKKFVKKIQVFMLFYFENTELFEVKFYFASFNDLIGVARRGPKRP